MRAGVGAGPGARLEGGAGKKSLPYQKTDGTACLKNVRPALNCKINGDQPETQKDPILEIFSLLSNSDDHLKLYEECLFHIQYLKKGKNSLFARFEPFWYFST